MKSVLKLTHNGNVWYLAMPKKQADSLAKQLKPYIDEVKVHTQKQMDAMYARQAKKFKAMLKKIKLPTADLREQKEEILKHMA